MTAASGKEDMKAVLSEDLINLLNTLKKELKIARILIIC
jgi:hypothetical protein